MKKSTQDSRVSYYKKPSDLSSEQYQIKLRLQFGEDHSFVIQNVGSQEIFSDYLVKNPQTGNSYKVSIRDFKNQWNYCSCLDFKTNQLGVCKHTASVFNHIRTKLGKDDSSNEYFIGAHSSVYVDYKNGRFVKLKIGTENREKYKALAARYFDSQFNLLGTSFPVFETFLKEAKAISEDFKCYEDALDLVLETRDNIKRRVTVLDAFSKRNKVQILDSLLKTKLFPFQIEGVLFASLAARSLIADEMGLGKTIQALATAEVYKQLFKISKVLIVCPTSLKYQWKSEIEKFTDSKAEIIEGTSEARKQQLSTSQAFYLIASYQSVSNDIQDSNGDFGLDMVILDEAQRIKNWSTKVAGNIKKLQSPYAVVLTGTPLENRLEELYSIMQFVDVWKLGPLYKFLDNHRITDPQSQKIVGYKNLNVIAEELSDTMLRRTKKEVLGQLPERSDKTLLVSMTREQRDIHDKLKEQVSRLVSKWQKSGFLNEKDRQMLILNLSKMRMVCDSTYIIDQSIRHDTKISELMTLLEEYLENPENKVVVFSQWERMTRLVSEELSDRNIEHQYLHGGVSASARKKLVDNFAEDPASRVFLSTDAGSVGLNLQSAGMVVNLDIPWNPAVLEQRIGRVFRLGQKQNVTVVNLVASGSIEERMLGLLKFKSALASGVLDDGESAIFLDNDRFSEFIKTVDSLTESTEVKAEEEETETDDWQKVIKQGQEFLTAFSEMMKDPRQKSAFLASITDRDANGQLNLKIPIKNEKSVELAIESVLNLFVKE